ncbi:2-C-methyl-D-erythritol 4-phosphate cytidylyltransferase [Nocardioides sambongensis]|uniref:2-C-methyl-D-erythritol 4-phosphate cytidylyltransferase n=1 Tax=Nocardioides sambongensis TaxID=2589074 RepID=UPI001128593A|nr:2-C-methyl-D-erythritol 4-phosphate cytidylyltransferase [Nocardioides sambongensis]
MTQDPYDASGFEPIEDLDREQPPAAGVIVEQERGALPFRLIHGESLVATAAWAAGDAGIDLVDASLGWDVVAERGEPLVLHDPLCPMTPPQFLRRCLQIATETGEVVVGVRPVTDTVKEVRDGEVGATRDRDGLVALCSPVVLPPAVVESLVEAQQAGAIPADFGDLIADLRGRGLPVRLVEAPAEARRVGSEADIAVLEAQTRGS